VKFDPSSDDLRKRGLMIARAEALAADTKGSPKRRPITRRAVEAPPKPPSDYCEGEEPMVPARHVRELRSELEELRRILGKQSVKLEILKKKGLL
jgi:hypothetical protein